MPRFVVAHGGYDDSRSKPMEAAADLFARGGQVGPYVFEVVPDEERPLLYAYTLVRGGLVPAFRPVRDLLYVDLGEEQTPEDMLAFLEAHFKGQMPGRFFWTETKEEFVAHREENKRKQESYVSKK